MGQPFQMTRDVLSYNILCVCQSLQLRYTSKNAIRRIYGNH